MIPLDHLCDHLIHLLHVPIHLYGPDGVLEHVYIERGEQEDVFQCDPAFTQQVLSLALPQRPTFYKEGGGNTLILYGIVGTCARTAILGPACLGSDPIQAGTLLMQAHHLSYPYRLGRLHYEHFSEGVLMLFEEMTGQAMSFHDLLFEEFCGEDFDQALRAHMNRYIFSLREDNVIHNPYEQEIREQTAIQEGNLQALYASFNESYVGQPGKLADDPIRNMKNLCIVVITLACRSAIAGGVLPEIAFSMSDAYIQKVEQIQDIPMLWAIGRQAELEFCRAVQDLAPSGKTESPVITRCKNLIEQRLHSKIVVSNLASELHISSGYLSTLFAQETGMHLLDYIHHRKIQEACRALIFTNLSISDIAASLAFSSQSRFSQLFRQKIGMTPMDYRETQRRILSRNDG